MLPIWRIKDIILFNGCYKTTRMFRKVSVGWTSRNKPELVYCTGKWSPLSIILERVSLKAATTMSDSKTHHPCRYAGTLQPLEPSRFLAGSTLHHHGHLASSALSSLLSLFCGLCMRSWKTNKHNSTAMFPSQWRQLILSICLPNFN